MSTRRIVAIATALAALIIAAAWYVDNRLRQTSAPAELAP